MKLLKPFLQYCRRRYQGLYSEVAAETPATQSEDNSNQLFVHMTAPKIVNPGTDFNERLKNGEFKRQEEDDMTDDEFIEKFGRERWSDEDFEAFKVRVEAWMPLWENKPKTDLLTLFFNSAAKLLRNSLDSEAALKTMADAIINALPLSENIETQDIEALDLSMRSYNCLKRANINTIGDITSHSQYWLTHNVRNLRQKSVEEIIDKLAQNGVFLEELAKGESAEEEAEQAEKVAAEPSAMDVLNGMIGLTAVKERMNDFTAHCTVSQLKSEVCGTDKPIVPNMVFSGNPGTGKSTVAKLVAQAFKEMGLMNKGHLVSATRESLVAEFTGQSAVKTTKVFMSALDGVLFVDEAYSLHHKQDTGRAGDTFTHEVIDTLTGLMTEYAGRCCVIFAGYKDEMTYMLDNANPGLRERFPFKLHFEDYDVAELQEIFLLQAYERKLIVSDGCKKILSDTIERLHKNKGRTFANGRVVENYLQEVILRQERRLYERKQDGAELTETELLTLTPDDFQGAAQPVIDGMTTTPEKRPIGFTSSGV